MKGCLECQVRSVINESVLSGSKVEHVTIGTIMSVTANPASGQEIRCHWDIASSVITGFQGEQHPIVAKAQHAAETVLKPGECIAVFNEPRGKGEDAALFLLTPKRFEN